MSSGPAPVYFKDMWALGPAPNKGMNCKGRFPQGLMDRLMERWGMGKKNKLMLFSGTFHEPGWVTVDVRPEMEPTHVCNCEKLPFPDASFDLVVLDPPYSEQQAKDLYGLKYVKMGTALNEAARVLRPGGVMCLLHPIIYDKWGGGVQGFPAVADHRHRGGVARELPGQHQGAYRLAEEQHHGRVRAHIRGSGGE